ncbi:ADP-ribosyltransferase [Capnocytophaga catalasegens]|uniref:Phage head morphogenesis protein n=1 Tax=Capnocytophaga catalasegens TaxID=1004260 RepID=A0AAV5AZW6_9FLAO|nr:ADP-ribosyltransferase [Capnocytophaga catalasegens]GIZ15293.1 hypothetical protein RCZ03_12930 [Capnocytophaga catalasegens]GJM51227.1 hypothetical protein RCZ15_22000 [Capnocytophaga catalasegens]GJM53021.1 hypothetical protein RCZ16_13380 [Capnocytophaga catalasegens]
MCASLNLSEGGRKALSFGEGWERILKTAEKAFKKLFDKGSYKPEDLFKTKEYKALVKETTKAFNSTISHKVTDDLRKHLEHGNLAFSGLKTHAQLTEARSLLKDENGNIRPYYQFEQDILKLNNTYNKNYLEAEYEFAVQSAQSVERWQTFSDDAERYWLEYRTAGDERVRADHDALRGVCLPKTDPFWESYYPPLGWRCRCTVVQVLASEKQLSDSKKARELGERVTTQIGASGKNKLEMFRFNPALEKTLFPKNNSYSKVVGADKVKRELEKEKPITYKNVFARELRDVYREQNFDKDNEDIIMGRKTTGYVQTANSFDINADLRENIPLSSENKIIVEALDSLIKNNKLKDNMMLYRNVRNDFIEAIFGVKSSSNISQMIDDIKKTNITTYADKGFTSVSAIKEDNAFKGRSVHLEIRTKKGTNAFVTSNYEESEIILGRNQKMNIIDVTENNGKIKLILETD